MVIHTSRLLIRPFQAHDDHALFEYLSNPVVYRYEPGAPISREQARAIALERSQRSDFWAVIVHEAQKMVGHVYFTQIAPTEFRTWELGYIFNPVFQNRGYATEAAYGLIMFGFEHLGMHRVIAQCNPENIASWRVLEKLGMRREGYFRKNVFFHTTADGCPIWVDTYAYALLKEDTTAT